MSEPVKERMLDWVYEAAGIATSCIPSGSYEPLLAKVREIYEAGRDAQREEDAALLCQGCADKRPLIGGWHKWKQGNKRYSVFCEASAIRGAEK